MVEMSPEASEYGDGSLGVLLQFARTQEAGDPFDFRFEPQDYILPTVGGASPTARFEWTPEVLSDLQEVRRPGCDPAVVQRIGERLRRFIRQAGWVEQEREITQATAAQRPIFLTIRSSAAELYALPWELLTLKSGQHLGEVDGLLLRYEWPESESAPEPPRSRDEGGRILVAWSAAAGAVPAREHIQAIAEACAAGSHEFDLNTDVLSDTSLARLVQKLEETERAGTRVAILHLLCHGAAAGSTFGLALDGENEKTVVNAAQLRQQLGRFANTVRLIVLSACDSGNLGAIGNALGSVAQALHRCGFQAVIASRFPLSVAGSIKLTESLYHELLSEPSSLETAFLAARKLLSRWETGLPRDSQTLDWASLQLYASQASGDDTRPIVFRPFRGLLAFGREHRRFLFGRDAEVAEVLSDLQALLDKKQPRFLVVAGASGTGKSSLVFAGAVPKLLDADPRLIFLKMRPGPEPGAALDDALSKWSPGTSALLVVDQFEEVFTQTPEPAARQAFAARLWALASSPEPGLRIIITLRVDYIGRCGELILNDAGLRLDSVAYDEQYRVFVAQLKPRQLRATITEPARKVGLALEAGLADRIVSDVGGEPGALPLLEDALDVLWQHRRDRLLIQSAYNALGGAVGALQKRADAILEGLTLSEQPLVQALLLSLVAIADETTMDSRLRVPVAEIRQSLAEAETVSFDRVLKELVDARLLVLDDVQHTPTVEVAHEALIRKWPRLRAWLDEDRTSLLMQRRVKQAAQQWTLQECDESLLYRGGQLASAVLWRTARKSRLGAREQRFLDASEAHERRLAEQQEAQRRQEQERREQLTRLQLEKQQQRTRLLRIGIAISSSLALLACVLGALAFRQTRLANRRLDLAADIAGQIATVGEERLSHVAGAAESRRDLLALSSKLLKTLDASGHSKADHAQLWRLFKQGDLIRSNPHPGEQQLKEATRLYEQALTIAETQQKKDPRNAVWKSDLSTSYAKLGEVLQEAGKLPEATRRFEESLAIRSQLAAADPTNTQWQSDLATSYTSLGGVLRVAAGKLPEATRRYEQSLALRSKLAAVDPSNTQWQSDLATSYTSLGVVLQAAGKLPEATGRHEESLAIRSKLAAADPSNTQWQNDLAASYTNLGEVLEAAGKLPEAMRRFEEGLAIDSKLAAADPSNAQWQHDLSYSYIKLGHVLQAAGKLPEATRRYKESLATAGKLAASDPSNTQGQFALFNSDNSLGAVLEAAGELPEATRRYEESLAIAGKLVTSDPSNTQWQRALSISYINLGDVLSAAGKLTEATQRYEESLTIASKLAAVDPSNEQWQHDLFVSYNDLGNVLEAAGKLPEATQRYEEALAIASKLAAADPSNTQGQRDLSAIYNNLGLVLRAAGKLPEATQRYEEALAIASKLAAVDPSNEQWQLALSNSYTNLGSVLKAAGKLPAATQGYQEALAIASKLAAADPSNKQRQYDLSISGTNLGDVLQAAGKLPEATRRFEESLAIRSRLAAADPGNTQRQNDLSASYSNLGDVLQAAGKLPEATRRFEESLAIRSKLAAADPSNTQRHYALWTTYHNLGVVLERAGKLPEATRRYEESLALASKLAATDPSNTQWQRNLMISHLSIVVLLGSFTKRGDGRAESRVHHAAASAILDRLLREHLFTGDPMVSWAQQTLARFAKLIR